MATKKVKKVAKKATKKGSGITAAMTVSKELQAVIKVKSVSRGEMMKKVWAYIKKHDLQDPNDKRTIKPDATLAGVLGKKPINMFKMTAQLSKHLS